MRLVYDDLRNVAGRHLHRRHGSRAAELTLQPTALVNEAYLRLIKQRKRYDNRGHFFAIASKVMLARVDGPRPGQGLRQARR